MEQVIRDIVDLERRVEYLENTVSTLLKREGLTTQMLGHPQYGTFELVEE